MEFILCPRLACVVFLFLSPVALVRLHQLSTANWEELPWFPHCPAPGHNVVTNFSTRSHRGDKKEELAHSRNAVAAGWFHSNLAWSSSYLLCLLAAQNSAGTRAPEEEECCSNNNMNFGKRVKDRIWRPLLMDWGPQEEKRDARRAKSTKEFASPGVTSSSSSSLAEGVPDCSNLLLLLLLVKRVDLRINGGPVAELRNEWHKSSSCSKLFCFAHQHAQHTAKPAAANNDIIPIKNINSGWMLLAGCCVWFRSEI